MTVEVLPALPASLPDGKVVIEGQGADKVKEGGTQVRIWWENGAFVVLVHLIALYAVLFVTPAPATKVMTFVTFASTLFGITAGYHRLWSHGAYTAALPTRIALAILGTIGFQGSIRWWALRHRLHHRFTDTEHDPYSSKRGLFYSHIGWIFIKPHYPRLRMIDASDLDADPVVVFQHRYYIPLALFFGFVLPPLVGSLYGDALGAFLYGGFLVRVLVWHTTFCINSIAHWAGDRLYSTQSSARGNLICAILTCGEGYHNFHHAFPKDYRNGVRWYDYDPTKWLIAFLHAIGQADNLFRSDDNEMRKARLQVLQEEIDAAKKNVKYGPEPESLPTMSIADLQRAVAEEGREYLIIDGFVLDMTPFKAKHPGGSKILRAYYGKDATNAFHGGLNMHTSAALNLAEMYRIARVA